MLMIVCGVIPWRDCGRESGCRDAEIQTIWGCKTETAEYPVEVETDSGTEKIWRCPWAVANECGAWEVMRYWSHYKNGHLPEGGGGVNDQPQKLMAAIEFIEQNMGKYRKMAEGLSDTDGE